MLNWLKIQNYMKAAFQSIKKSSLSSFLVVLGLAISLLASSLILSYGYQHLTFEEDLANSESIFRATLDLPEVDLGGDGIALTPAGVKNFLKGQLDSSTQVTQFISTKNFFPIMYKGLKREEFNPVAVDESFFEVFDFETLNISEKFSNENGIIISRTLASKVFSGDPVGQVISFNGTAPLEVVGVFDDLPQKTHLNFNAILPLKAVESISPRLLSGMRGGNFYTYIRSNKKRNDFTAVEDNLSDVLTDSMRVKVDASLMPIEEIHLTQNYLGEMKPAADVKVLYLILTLGGALAVIGGVNFYNLFSARLAMRNTEFGVRIIQGASKIDIFIQAQVEYLILLFISLMLALSLLELTFERYLSEIIDIAISNSLVMSVMLYLFVALVIALSLLLFIHVLKLNTVKSVIGGSKNVAGNKLGSKKILVAIQTALSIVVLYLGVNVTSQVSELSQVERGFDDSDVWISPQVIDSSFEEQFAQFEARVSQLDGVKTVTYGEQFPSMSFNDATSELTISNIKDVELSLIPVVGVYYDYLEALDTELLAGRTFTREFESDFSEFSDDREHFGIVVTKTFVEQVGWTDYNSALGSEIRWDDKVAKVVGIIDDVRFTDLQQESSPIFFALGHKAQQRWNIAVEFSDTSNTVQLNEVSQIFDSQFGHQASQFDLLSNLVRDKNSSLFAQLTILLNFAAIVITLCLLGVFALAKFGTDQRQRELVIRKVLGASQFRLQLMLQWQFLMPAIISSILAATALILTQEIWSDSLNISTSASGYSLVMSVVVVLLLSSLTVAFVGYRSIATDIVTPLQSD